MIRTKSGVLVPSAILAALILMAVAPAAARDKKLLWKPVDQVLLKLNNHPVKTWNVLQADKNRNLVLVQLLNDWYILNLKEKRAYKVDRKDFDSRGENLAGPAPDKNTPVAKTDGWDSHDIGPAQQITVKFADTGDVLAIELPHPLAIY
ncbi:MAG: hypothetical protein KGL59_08570 [Acidobacteriota bacterium]|nr:hypothetical protein [Acidobacteriota bacterium]